MGGAMRRVVAAALAWGARRATCAVTAGAAVVLVLPAGAAAAPFDARHSLRPPLTAENFYFVMADRFDNGDAGQRPRRAAGRPPGQSGFDPTAKGFYHGGDLAGLRQRLDYIKGLGTTAIWLTPSFKNKAVQLEDGPSAGYHGYWITDFTQIDPHLGTNAEPARRSSTRRTRAGMKVYFDIITNHTADVIDYEEGAAPRLRVQGRARPTGRAAASRSTTATTPARTRFPALSRDRRASRTRPFVARRASERQGAGLAQRRHALPQPRQHDLHRRGLPLRRLLRPRRPVHREPAASSTA